MAGLTGDTTHSPSIGNTDQLKTLWHTGAPLCSAYCASKFAVRGLTQTAGACLCKMTLSLVPKTPPLISYGVREARDYGEFIRTGIYWGYQHV